MMLDNVYAFLPGYIDERNEKCEWEDSDIDDPEHVTISDNEKALILAIFSIAQIVFAPFNAYIKNKIGAKNTIIFGFLLITASTFGLGALHFIQDHNIFKISALALRFL